MKKIRAEILSTGTEILQGKYPDTNAQNLSIRLQERGIEVLYHTTAGDDRETLASALAISRARADLIVMTGGLGPTEDDLNRFIIAEVYNRTLVKDEKAERMIREHFKKRNIAMPEGNLVQARIPAGSIPLYNPIGTAPGFILHDPEKHHALVALPGPPREWIPMFEDPVSRFLREHFPTETVYETLTLRTIDVPESKLNEQLAPLFGCFSGITLALLARPGKVDIRATVRASSRQESKRLLGEIRGKILSRIDADCIYGEKENATIEGEVARLLTEKRQVAAAAESCTGGLLTKRLTDIPGSSAYIKEGIITYSNEAKMRYIGVRLETLKKYGAVSGEVAAEMAAGMRRVSGADLAVGITGIAGPAGGTPEKPVGLVYFGLATEEGVSCRQKRFTGERSLIRERATDFALDMIRRILSSERK